MSGSYCILCGKSKGDLTQFKVEIGKHPEWFHKHSQSWLPFCELEQGRRLERIEGALNGIREGARRVLDD